MSSLTNIYDNDVECENSANIFAIQCEEGTIRINWAQGRGKNITQKKPGPQCHDAMLDQIIPAGNHVSGFSDCTKKPFSFLFMSFYVTLNQKQTYITQHLGCRITG